MTYVSSPHLASPSGGLPSAVGWCHLLMADRVRAGAVLVDATAGNGHDTLFLARLAGASGHVHAFDVQEAAVRQTRMRLLEAGVPETCFTLHHAGHETMAERLPAEMHGQVAGILFNLGYLPGSDKTVITRTETTLAALKQALHLLAGGGLLCAAIYPGHAGGAEEREAISAWAEGLCPRSYEVQQLRPVNRAAAPPECWAIWKRPR